MAEHSFKEDSGQERAAFISRVTEAMSRKDYQRVMELACQAALDGFSIGYAYQGMLNLYGLGVARDTEKAKELLRMGAVKGDPASALEYVKQCIRESKGDTLECFLFLNLAASARIPKAEYLFALYLWDGRNCPRDEQQAFCWMQKAAQDGEEDALAYTGLFHALGIGTKQDRARGRQVLEEAAAKGNNNAYEMLREMFSGQIEGE